ncbi:uncharacterized protein LOC119076310 [Bradysia coprophila]|uniref:uncharacterized protein LOC119076310 n=1 Tax=Bradysia coprophila TaxID=38358 RepID=UPI00187D7FE6|nr:uncharacterized protein LOC119076310 [Bradysia coprophila]
MSVKMREIFIFSLLMLHSSIVADEIDCSDLTFFCTTDNTYLPCFYDEVRNITVTVSDRSEACPSGTFCDSLSDEPCNAGIDCSGKEFFCPTTSSYMRCDRKPDGTFRTSSNDVQFCPEDIYCDNIYGTVACDSSVIPDPVLTTDEATSESTEAPTETTETPTETTEAPTETTEAPTETTEAPTETTEAPTETTEAPTETTKAPTETTEAPTETTEAPTETTEAPIETTEAPTTTIAPPLGELVGYTCAGAGRYPHPTDCRRYIFCAVFGSTYRNSQRQCPNELVYHADSDGCKLDTTPCDNMDFKCVTTGRFADPLNPSKYVWCLRISGSFHAFKYTCPIGKIYDGNNACVEPIVIAAIDALAEDEPINLYSTSRRSLAVRNNDEAVEEWYVESDEMVADRISLISNEDASVYAREATAAPTESTETPTTTIAPPLGELVGYTCAGDGLYPHPTDCRRYISCSVSGLTYKNRQRQCPNELVYHADYEGCKLDTTPCDNMDFKCVTTGRFADPLNPSKYVWCLRISGSFHALKYSCPIGKIYDGNNACVEPIVITAIDALAEDDPLNLYSTSRRSLAVRNDDEADEERYVESDEMVADRISLNSNEDASVYARDEKYSRL